MTIPTTKSWVDDEVVTHTDINTYVRDAFTWLISGRPSFHATNTSAYTYNSAGWHAIPLNTEQRKQGCTHSANASAVYPTEAGWYRVAFMASFDANGAGTRGAAVRKNGSTYLQGHCNPVAPHTTSTDTSVCGVSWVYMNGTTDYLELVGNNGSGSTTIKTSVATGMNSFMGLTWIARDQT